MLVTGKGALSTWRSCWGQRRKPVKEAALAAITQNPPAFLESVVLELADDSRMARAVIPGLKKLGTRAAKDKLAELAASKNLDASQPAIEGLAELGDSTYCPVMLGLVERSPGYSRFALRGTSYLCHERAIPLVVRFLNSPDQSLRCELAYALGNTHARDAVPILFNFVTDGDENVRRAAADALTTLTHFSQKSGVENLVAATQTRRAWITWWYVHGKHATIYGPEDCRSYPVGE
jgi:HEAT repeat protein